MYYFNLVSAKHLSFYCCWLIRYYDWVPIPSFMYELWSIYFTAKCYYVPICMEQSFKYEFSWELQNGTWTVSKLNYL